MNRTKWILLVLLVVPCSGVPRRSVVARAPVAASAIAVNEETVAGLKHFGRGYPADDGAGGVTAVIEIPCGTTAKIEVDDDDGWMHWRHDRVHGGRREIDYLAFPVNYGMVPRTLAGDGDALDIVVLGAGIERGRVARTRVIGVLEMADDESADGHDDKLIAVPDEPELANGFTRLHDLSDLDEHYPAVREILELWFSYYWGEGATEVLGWGDAAQAEEILEAAKHAYGAKVTARDVSARSASSGRALRDSP